MTALRGWVLFEYDMVSRRGEGGCMHQRAKFLCTKRIPSTTNYLLLLVQGSPVHSFPSTRPPSSCFFFADFLSF